MPTAARLISAIVFAAIGYAAAHLAALTLEEGVSAGLVREVAAGMGVVTGWFIAGKHAPRSWGFGAAYGLNASAVLLISTLVILSAAEMFARSLKGRYDGPMEGLEAMIGIALDWAVVVLMPPIMAVLVLGGLAGGLLAHAVSRVWR
ncbi:TrgA family protein [Anianabacter salinae]|uniref:TrgA family protein n=1 Tax=Anianabacter salinae TaxID=2851023 RepID=UPI00225E50AF|nr:TrgA family protein [Anianabacter salinae]MBV0912203.1 TrgA family protein [Anianabacter salinae]